MSSMLEMRQNYDLLLEFGFGVNNGIIYDQDLDKPVELVYNGKSKILINYIEGTRVDWRYYEDFNPYYNFKQLKALVEYYVQKLSIEEDPDERKYFVVLGTQNSKDDEDKVCIVGITDQQEEVSSRYFDKNQIYLCYIDFLFALSGNYNQDLTLYTLDRD